MAPADAAPSPRGVAWREVQRRRGGAVSTQRDALAEEVPVAIRCNGQPFAVMMASPLDLADFAHGFALTEQLVDESAQLLDLRVGEALDGYTLDLQLPADLAERAAQRARMLDARSGCGICGSRELEQHLALPPALAGDDPLLDAAALQRGLAQLPQRQQLNQATGATHAAAWCDRHGDIVCLREDVGRHNALDKLIGALRRAGAPTAVSAGGFVLLTSRASYEMVLKSARAGIAVVAAVSAPTALAVATAASCGVTLIAFARGSDCSIYTHPQRFAHV